MKFEFLLEDLLTELSGEEIYKKYYNKIPYNVFVSLVEADPQSKVLDNTIQRIGKYGKMLIGLYQKGGLRLEDLDRAKEYLSYVYKHNVAIDLNKIKDLTDVYDLVKQYIIEDKKTLEEILKALPEQEYELLFNGQEWIIYQPRTERAACYLGYNTEWCTTWGPLSLNDKHKDRSNRFQSYAKDGPLYIMINKKIPDYKFQFHFESNQFMDKDDRRINTKQFLQDETNKEIFKFFFPSYFGEVSQEQLDLELKRFDLLPDEWSMKLLEKVVKNNDNPIIKAIINKNEEELENLIQSENLTSSPFIEDNKLVFSVGKLEDDVEEHYNTINYYESESSNGWDWVYNDVRDRGIDEYMDDEVLKFFKDYFEENKNTIQEELGYIDFEQFHKDFYENYKNNEDIKEAFYSDVADLSYENYEQNNSNIVKKEKEYIDIDYGYDIKIGINYFVKFVLRKGIKSINDEDNWPLMDTLSSFIRFYGLYVDYEGVYDYEQTYPKYGNNGYLEKETDNFFDKFINNPENSKRCAQLRKQFNEIKNKYFKNSSTYENDIVLVRLISDEIDCDKEMIKISYFNKQDGDMWSKRKTGWVKLDNLISLMTNYKLFESIKKQLASLSSK